MTEGFATKVATAVAATGPMCAGIDPSADLLGAWGLADTPEGLRSFGLSCVEAFAGVVPVVKPRWPSSSGWGPGAWPPSRRSWPPRAMPGW